MSAGLTGFDFLYDWELEELLYEDPEGDAAANET